MSEASIAGFLNIDKPSGPTSHDVVVRLRRHLRVKKVGHVGTLDPLATGVLVICLGYATRLSEYAMASTKRYRARVHLGLTTDTYDASGTILERRNPDHITRHDVEQALAKFVGNIEQLPPLYSAVKQGGRKLYELARAGKTVQRKPRPVHIETLVVREWQPPQLVLEVTCSAGTYVRSLAHDLGQVLGVGAHLAGLVRTASGAFVLDDAVVLTTLLNDLNWQQYLLPPEVVLDHLPAVYLDVAEIALVRQGRPVPQVGKLSSADYARAYAPDGVLAAILKKADRGMWRPHKVFSS